MTFSLKRIIKHFFLAFLFLLSGIVQGQSYSPYGHGRDSVKTWYSPLYIKKYHKTLAITPIFLIRDFTLGFASGKEAGRSVVYSPNLVPQWGMDLDYNWLSIEVTSSWGMRGNADQLKGKTYKLGLAGSFTRYRWMALGTIQYFRGLYISNPEDLHSDFVYTQNTSFPRREDMKVLAGRLSVNYIFNSKKYSHASSLFVTTERQMRSAGSFIVGGNFALITVGADSSVIPPSISADFDSSSYVMNSHYYMLFSHFGYAHTFIIKKSIYLDGGLQVGLGPVYSKVIPEKAFFAHQRLDLGATAEIRMSFGYNGDRLYGGFITTIISTTSTADKKSTINNSMYLLRFFLGYRFPIKQTIPILG